MKKNIRKIIEYIKPYKYNALLNISFNILYIIFSLFSLTLVMPFLMILFDPTANFTALQKPEFEFSSQSIGANFSYYLSIFADGSKTKALLFVCLMVVGSFFLKNVFLFTANYFMAPLMNGIVKDIRNKIYKKILELPLAYYSDERKGDIISRMTNDVKEIQFSVMSSIEMVFRDPFTILFYIVTLIVISPHLTLFVAVLLPISGIIIGVVGKNLRRTSRNAQDKIGILMSTLEETLSGLRVIQAFNADTKMYQRFVDFNKNYTKVMNRLFRKNYLASPVSEFLGASILVLILFYGGNLVLDGKSDLHPSKFVAYLVIFSQVLNPAKSITNAYYNILKGLASIDRVNVILDAENTIVEKADAKEIHSFNQSIEYKNVTFKYTQAEVLKNVNITIQKGKTVALVGQSGSGKSTLADLLPRFWDVEVGEILIDNIPIKDLKVRSLRNLMGNVNQEAILFNDSIYNNIAFGVENTTLDDVIAAAKVANAHDFIMETPDGYNTNIGDRGSKLSGGQRQRLSIARAVLKNPPILILDEATSALDTESERLVQDALQKLMKNRTSVVIAHRLSTIKSADLICVLQSGEIAEQGTHDELIAKNGIYKKLCDLQMF